MAKQLVLLIHGVSSTGEWHDTTTRECHGLFECVPIKYRYYHGWTGAIKVYAWPTALVLLAATGVLMGLGTGPAAIWSVLAMLLFASVWVYVTDRAWSPAQADWGAPAGFTALGVMTALTFPGPLDLLFPLGCLAGVLFYLDLLEYSYPDEVGTAKRLLVPGVGALTFGGACSWAMQVSGNERLWVLLAVIAVACIVEPFVRNRRAFKYVMQRIEETQGPDQCFRPHVVAHSLGTYLTGHLLYENERFTLGRVIFTGCVLDRRFPWHRLVGNGSRGACLAVKNYVGGTDVVPVLTGTLRLVWVTATLPARIPGVCLLTELLGRSVHWRPLGAAGHRGFRIRDGVVHDLLADVRCEICYPGNDQGALAYVHNVPSWFAGHSTINQSPGHQRFQWLPYLWGDSPDKFELWKSICVYGHAMNQAYREMDPNRPTQDLRDVSTELEYAEERLLKGPWYWPLHRLSAEPDELEMGCELRDYVVRIIGSHARKFGRGRRLPDVDTIVDRIPTIIFEKFDEALRERMQENPREEIVAMLEPRNVLFAAVFTAAGLDTVEPEPEAAA